MRLIGLWSLIWLLFDFFGIGTMWARLTIPLGPSPIFTMVIKKDGKRGVHQFTSATGLKSSILCPEGPLDFPFGYPRITFSTIIGVVKV